jgi:hypothetical protein
MCELLCQQGGLCWYIIQATKKWNKFSSVPTSSSKQSSRKFCLTMTKKKNYLCIYLRSYCFTVTQNVLTNAASVKQTFSYSWTGEQNDLIISSDHSSCHLAVSFHLYQLSQLLKISQKSSTNFASKNLKCFSLMNTETQKIESAANFHLSLQCNPGVCFPSLLISQHDKWNRYWLARIPSHCWRWAKLRMHQIQ